MAANNLVILSGIVESVSSVSVAPFNEIYKVTLINIWTAPTYNRDRQELVYNLLTVRVLGRVDKQNTNADKAIELLAGQIILVQGSLVADESRLPYKHVIAADKFTLIGDTNKAEPDEDPLLNIATAAGNLGGDAETRYTSDGKAIVSFSIAASDIGRDSAPTWFRAEAWNNENVGRYLTKGSTVGIEGVLRPESYNDQAGNLRHSLKVSINSVSGIRLLGGRGSNGDGGNGSGNANGSAAPSRPVVPTASRPAAPAPTNTTYTPIATTVATPVTAATATIAGGDSGGDSSVDQFVDIPF